MLLTCIINNQSLTILQGLLLLVFDHWVPALSTNTTPPACPPLPASRGSSVHTKWGTRATLGWLETIEKVHAPPRFWDILSSKSIVSIGFLMFAMFKIINPLILRRARPHIFLCFAHPDHRISMKVIAVIDPKLWPIWWFPQVTTLVEVSWKWGYSKSSKSWPWLGVS